MKSLPRRKTDGWAIRNLIYLAPQAILHPISDFGNIAQEEHGWLHSMNFMSPQAISDLETLPDGVACLCKHKQANTAQTRAFHALLRGMQRMELLVCVRTSKATAQTSTSPALLRGVRRTALGTWEGFELGGVPQLIHLMGKKYIQ
ncbi:hypothetical protein DUNSADRAFT_10934 [Dunaliella salina]|uniref:Uncharacterized protein n=1 Tax=Dunaliella salina TaxID=3046 RepID=A0ABQ7GEI1_DUNSA|nr:hypothetical protein DUNSADRAFT_10934 [Dunaliella salina]|eukprot:KAF5833013.1 hypothetical protein DUNSADRAFT_10934 [Dunaliella salina]